MPNNASTKWGRTSLVLEAIQSYLTALRPVYVPLRSKSGTCPATRRLLPGYGAKRHPDGQRDDGLTRNGRLTARRERIFEVDKKFQTVFIAFVRFYDLNDLKNVRSAI